MHNWVAKNIVYRGIQALRQEPVFSALRDLRQSEVLDTEALATLQRQRLRSILIHAYQSTSFYRRRFDDCGFVPEAFQDLNDLQRIPLLTKQDIQDHLPEMLSTSYRGQHSEETTSGSTGTPFRFCLCRGAGAAFRAAMYREHAWVGLDVGAKEARFYGVPMEADSRRKEVWKDRLMNRQRFSVFTLDDDSMAQYWQRMQRFQPEYLYGYTSAVFRFSDYLARQQLRPTFAVRAVIVTSEVLHEAERKIMEEVWQAPVINEYGASELGIIAHECPDGGMHLVPENNVVEILSDNKPTPVGQPGEIVVTSLVNHYMPLIRYRIGDVGSLRAETCGCGRAAPLMNVVEGRLNNMVTTPEGNVASGLVFYYVARDLIEHNVAMRRFIIRQKAIDHIHFVVESEQALPQECQDHLTRRTHEYLSPQMRVTFATVDEIPVPPSGKLLHFVSELDVTLTGTQWREPPAEHA